MSEWNKEFWIDEFEGTCRDGMFYRSMKIGQFIKDCEEKGYKIVGVRFDESNNCEFMFVPPEEYTG